MPRDEERKREYSRRKRESEEVRARENEYRRRKRESEEVRERENAYSKEYYYRNHSPQSEYYEEYKARRRIWNSAFRERNNDKLTENRRKRREEIREWYRQYKTTVKCIRCGENDPACLHFHHRNSGEKKMNVATYVFEAPNLKAFIRELNKCEVLCANCHFIEHWHERDEASDFLKRENLEQQLMDTKGWFPRMKIKKKIYKLNAIIWYNRYKRTLACHSCGVSHPACLQFHHRNQDDKIIEVSNLVSGASNIDQLKREIDKCEVLCANCHAKYHWGDINWNIVDDN